MNKIYTINEISEQITPIAKRYGIERVWLFGSYARGEANENSDIDLLVDYKKGLGLKFIGFVSDIEDTLGLHVDVITRESLYKAPDYELRKVLIHNIETDRREIIGQ